MTRVLILYGTTEGQTRKIAVAIGQELAQLGIDTNVVEADTLAPQVEYYSAIIIAASVHGGRYQKSVTRWVLAHAPRFGQRPTVFVSVSLGILQKNDVRVRAELDAIVKRFVDETGWTPSVTKHVAGALRYTQYNIFKRWIMKRIVAKAGGDTDASRDYEYTEWDDVRGFARDFGRRLNEAAA